MNLKQTEAYDLIERFLSNNLDSDDFAEYQLALDTLVLEAHPAKTLTDEEILEFKNKVPFSHSVHLIGFARAILKKASEK